MQAIGTPPTWMEEEWDKEEGRREENGHRVTEGVCIEWLQSKVLHFIKELMTFKGGSAGTEPLVAHEESGFYTTSLRPSELCVTHRPACIVNETPTAPWVV